MKLKKLLVLYGSLVFALSLYAQSNEVEINFNFNKKRGMASNQFAVWIEDADGEFIKTLYVTRFTGEGGYEKRPDSLPKWAKKHGKENINAVTKATPSTSKITCTWDFTDSNGKAVSQNEEYVFFVEGTVYWKDNVLYSGTINLKSQNAIKVNAVYSTDNAKKNSTISDVGATVN